MNCFGFTEVEPKPKSTKRLLREKLVGDEDGKGIYIKKKDFLGVYA